MTSTSTAPATARTGRTARRGSRSRSGTWGPFTNGHAYPQIQFETDVAASENLCNVGTGAGCKAPPIGSAGFYPFWSLTTKQKLPGVTGRGACLWNFGNVIQGVTTHDFGKDAQYGARTPRGTAGRSISKVLPNPTLAKAAASPLT